MKEGQYFLPYSPVKAFVFENLRFAVGAIRLTSWSITDEGSLITQRYQMSRTNLFAHFNIFLTCSQLHAGTLV